MEKIEKYTLGWIIAKRHRIFSLILITTAILISSQLPYINLFVSEYILIMTLVIITPIVLDLNFKILIGTGILLFLPTAFLRFIGQTEAAEALADYIFILLLSGTIKAFFV